MKKIYKVIIYTIISLIISVIIYNYNVECPYFMKCGNNISSSVIVMLFFLSFGYVYFYYEDETKNE